MNHVIPEDISLIGKIPISRKCCFCVNVKCGTILIAILGILFGFTSAIMFLLKDRKNLTLTTIILIVLITIFVVITILFALVSLLLLLAALDENSELMSYNIWLSMVYLCVQFILAVAIPIVLAIDGRYPYCMALMWMVIVMIIGLGWVHFISVVNTYRQSLL